MGRLLQPRSSGRGAALRALFVGGWGTNRPWALGWAAHLAQPLAARGLLPPAAREGDDYDVFDWGGPSWTLSSALMPLGIAARRLAARLDGARDLTLVGHSKGANVVLGYLAAVAEGRLPPAPGLRAAIAMNAPLDNLGGTAAVARLSPRRLAHLSERLAGRGMAPGVLVVHDPGDPVNKRLGEVPGLTVLSDRWGDPCGRFWIGSLQFWHPNHMACLRGGWDDVLARVLPDSV